MQETARTIEAYSQGLLQAGRRFFTTEEALQHVNAAPAAIRAQIRRFRKAGAIATPLQPFHLIVPPEYRQLGCLPADHFIDSLMQRLAEPYYVGLLSAAERHGAAHQRPQAFQVMTPANRRSIQCGAVRIEFIARRDLERMPRTTINSPSGYVQYATPEVTALDLVGYPDHAGGLNNVATVLAELVEKLDPEKLIVAASLSPIAWSQRLGYLLDLLGHLSKTGPLADFVAVRAKSTALLRRAKKGAPSKRNAKWKLLVNTDVEPDE